MLCWFIKRTTGCWYLGNGYLGIRVYMYPPTQCLLNSPFASHEEETGRQPARGLSSNGTSGSSSAVYPAPAVPTTKSIIICRQQRLYNQLNTFNKHLYYQQMTIPCQCQLPYSPSCRPPCQLPFHHHVGHLIGPPRFQSYGAQCWQGNNSRRNDGIFPIFYE